MANTDSLKLDINKLVAGRVSLLSLILLAASWGSLSESIETRQFALGFFVPLAALFAVCAFSILWVKLKSPGVLFICSQLLLDIAIVTGIVYATGGPISPFLFLYLPFAMMASAMLPRTMALFFAVLGGIAYAALTWGMIEGYIPSVDGTSPVDRPSGGMMIQLLGLFSALILISIFTNFLRRQLAASYAMAAQSARDLFNLSQRQNALVSGMPDGVVVISQDKLVNNINPAACELLNITEEDVLDKPFADVLMNIGVELRPEHFTGDEARTSREISLVPKGKTKALQIAYHSRPIISGEKEKSGTIIIFQDVTQIRSIEEQLALQERMARMLTESSKETGPTHTRIDDFVGESPVMQKVFKLIERVATSDATVLIHGESGTGKELVAKAIHMGGDRSYGSFVPVNCGAIPENLIESELFGHKKGSFTGADRDHIGLFREAEGGTVFLDEIGELPLSMQAKILRVLQEKCVRPVGSEKTIPVDVRIVAATNRNLKVAVEKQQFREDLYYRLNVIGIQLPSLAERQEDIPLLVHSLLKKMCADRDKLPAVTPAAMQLLINYSYPGNVRELENILERAIVLGGEAVLPEHLPDAVHQNQGAAQARKGGHTEIFVFDDIELPMKLDDLLSLVEQRCLEAALSKTGGAKKKAANLLGINFRSFRYRLQKYEMAESETGNPEPETRNP